MKTHAALSYLNRSLAFLLVAGSFSAQGATYGNFTYEVDDTEVVITGYDCGSGAGGVVIPDFISGMPVTKIYSRFRGCTSLTSVTIGKNLTSIADDAFFGCTSLTDLDVEPLNLAYSSIDGVLFNKAQTRVLRYPTGRSGDYTIPDSATRPMGYWAFYGCTSLTSVTIPDGMTSITGGAFRDCTSLTNVIIPQSLTTIELSSFEGCASLAAMEVDSHNPAYSSVDGVLFNKEQTTMIRCPRGTRGDYTIPDGVTVLDGGAFSGCTSLTSVTIPASVTTIRSSIWSEAILVFEYCTSLAAIEVDSRNPAYSSVDGVLFDQGQTTLLVCPAGRIGAYTIPDGVSTLARRAFDGCTSLTSITIPASVNSIGDWAFSGCTSLADIEVDSLNSAYGSIEGVLLDKDHITLIRCPEGKSGDYAIPNGVSHVADCAFLDCDRLIRITVPESVGWLGEEAFLRADNLIGVYFEGDPPGYYWEELYPTPLDGSYPIVYYRPGTTSWGSYYCSRPTAVWIDPPIYSEWLPTTDLQTSFPNATAERDDPDQDGSSNYDEMLAGTEPTESFSVLTIEPVSRPDDLTADDQIAIEETQHAVYFQSVPGKAYAVQWAPSVEGPWHVDEVVTANTTQKRVLFDKPGNQAFYRVILAQ